MTNWKFFRFLAAELLTETICIWTGCIL